MTAVLDKPEVNEAFLREVLAWIELHPELWDQRGFVKHTACGTTYCLAGWAYVLGTGDHFTVDNRRRIRSHQPVYATATRLLGLTKAQADALFYFCNVAVPGPQNNGLGIVRPPTFAELCQRVEQVTGIQVKEPQEELEPDGVVV